MGFKQKYTLVGEGEDNHYEPQQKSSSVSLSWWSLLLCNLIAAVAGAAMMILLAGGYSYVSTPSSGSTAVSTVTVTATASSGAALTVPTSSVEADSDVNIDHVDENTEIPNMAFGEILDCGGSAEDARAKGCVYDVMMQDWVPEPCYDGVLTEKYLAEGNWTWYADGEGKTTMSDEQMRKGEHGVAWMSTSYHKAHCVFSWLKIIRALRNKQGISQELLSYDHVLHCSHGALKEQSNDEGLGVSAPTNYAKCALYDTWKYAFIPDEHDSHGRI